ncbi:hypothetical protein Btru_019709 [Bulinus truncatus]|nr:hypothetical protein Btru_019709 [Bulinus truncatus]
MADPMRNKCTRQMPSFCLHNCVCMSFRQCHDTLETSRGHCLQTNTDTMSLLLLAVVSCLSVVTAWSVNETPVIANFTTACQTSLNNSNTKLNCSLGNMSEDYELTVRVGFCTENEYSILNATVCSGNPTTYNISEAKTNFYAALSNVPSSCQQRAYYCINSSVLAVVSKQQEHFCSLIYLNISGNTSATCLTTGEYSCTENEFSQLVSVACKGNITAADQTFSKALMNTTATCQLKIYQCALRSPEAWSYVLSERYCESLKIGGNFTAMENCFKENRRCTDEDVDRVKVAACGATDQPTTQPTNMTSTTQPTNMTSTTQPTNMTSTTQPTNMAALTKAWSLKLALLSILAVLLN